jgi:hypothetical protein
MIEINKGRYSLRDDYAGVLFVIKGTNQIKYQPDYRKSFDLKNIMFDGACFWGTDKYRLHYYYMKDTDIEPGIYQVVKRDDKKITLDKTYEGFQGFPQIARLAMFTTPPEWNFSITLSINHQKKGRLKDHQNMVIEYSRLIKKMPEDVTVDFQFFSDLPPGDYEVYYYGDRKMIGICGEDKGSAVMPMIINDVG